MKKSFKIFKFIIVIILIVPCIFAFSACSISFGNQTTSTSSVYISDDGYWVINGTKTNTKAEGKDGKDAPQFTVKEVYEELLSEGYEGSFSDFIKEYFNLSVDLSSIVAKECKPSVVAISVNKGSKNGSGVVIKKDNNGNAYVLTNNHVASPYYEGNTSIKLYLASDDSKSNPISATLAAKNEDFDLAILKVENNELINQTSEVTFASKNPTIGDTCLAIGNTHSKGISVTLGNVSKELEFVSYTSGGQKYEVLRHCAYIEKGSSGGGLFNLAGELIGITNAGENGDLTLMNYAIPIENVNEFVSEFFNNL